MANTTTLADVKLVLSAPVHIQTKRSGYGKARVAFVSARTKFMDRLCILLQQKMTLAVAESATRCHFRN